MKNIGQRLFQAFRRFMTGRYGTDKLNNLLLGLGLATCFLNLFMGNTIVGWILTVLSYSFMLLALFRCFSRNTVQRSIIMSKQYDRIFHVIFQIPTVDFDCFTGTVNRFVTCNHLEC